MRKACQRWAEAVGPGEAVPVQPWRGQGAALGWAAGEGGLAAALGAAQG